MAKKRVKTVEVKEVKRVFKLKRNFKSVKYGDLKAGDTITLTNEETIKILTNEKYI